jgi:hypothetical protein
LIQRDPENRQNAPAAPNKLAHRFETHTRIGILALRLHPFGCADDVCGARVQYKWTQFNGDQVHNGQKTSVPAAVWHACARRSECARGFREYSDGSSRRIRLAMGARTCHDVRVLISMTARAYRTWYRDAAASRVSLVAVPRQSWL